MPMNIRKGRTAELPLLLELVEAVIADLEARQIHQWDADYPGPFLGNDLAEGALYVQTNKGRIVGCFVLNREQEAEGDARNWRDKNGNAWVLHRLCVHPAYRRHGIASGFLRFAEQITAEWGCTSIRLDVFAQNADACRLYERNGYENRGPVCLEPGHFHCFAFEKVLCR